MKKIVSAPYIDQTARWVNGCESISSVMLLQAVGIPIDPDVFIERDLPHAPYWEQEGRLYGPDPMFVYPGDPHDHTGYGCYAPCIVQALQSALKHEGAADRFEVLDVSGETAASINLSLICFSLLHGFFLIEPTLCIVNIIKLGYRWHLAQANLHTCFATRCKRTTCRRVQKIHRSSFDRNQSLMFLGIQSRDRTDQSLGIHMVWTIENIICRTILDDSSCIHNRNAVTHGSNNTQIMCDHDDRHAEFVLEFHHQFQDLCLNGNVQCGCRLICDQ